jgi:predicted short-subunit dehydrogenase-like oxidoreductase (DUF2520 family)
MRELERDHPITESAAEAPLPALAIVGAGRVGSSLAAAARSVGIEVSLAGRAQALATCRRAQAALLCVPDEAIAEAAAVAAEAVPPLELVGHVSGATTLEALAPASTAGAQTFSLHPLQTVPDPDAELTGSPCAISGSSAEALDFARTLALRLGMVPFAIAEDKRALYHAAACVASNFLVTLEESAAGLLEAAGATETRELLAPIVLRTAANWSESGGEALTGPVARGDRATVARHLDALRADAPRLVELYEALAERTEALTEGRG